MIFCVRNFHFQVQNILRQQIKLSYSIVYKYMKPNYTVLDTTEQSNERLKLAHRNHRNHFFFFFFGAIVSVGVGGNGDLYGLGQYYQ